MLINPVDLSINFLAVFNRQKSFHGKSKEAPERSLAM